MALLLVAILLGALTCCWTQHPTQYTMHTPALSVLENVGAVEICLSRTGDDINIDGTAFLTTEDGSAIGGDDFDALVGYSFEFDPNEKEKCLDFMITDDEDAEFKEKFTITIQGASDGIPGSQASTEITIEENDHCTEIPLTTVATGDSAAPFYVSPWDPVPGKPVVFKNTIGINNNLIIYLASSATIPSDIENVYQIRIELIESGNGDFKVVKNGQTFVQAMGALNLVQNTDGEIIEVEFDQSTATITLTSSSLASTPLTFKDIYGTPITVRHIFAYVADPGISISEAFTLCNADPIGLPRMAAEQSGTSQTHTGAVATRAIDNNRKSVVDVSETCIVTDNVEFPWWRVDLGKEYKVSAVNIFPIADGVATDLDDDDIAGAQVYVGSCNETYIEQQTSQLKLCETAPIDITSVGTGFLANTVFPTYIECTSSNTYGRYVYIRLNTGEGIQDMLHLCEVHIYGTEVPSGSETTVSFSKAVNRVAEGDTSISVNLKMSGPGSSCTAVDVYTEEDTAKSSGTTPDQMDFTQIPLAEPDTITFDPSKTMHSVNITVNPDTFCEDVEKLKLVLSNIKTGVIGMPSEAIIEITDDDTTQYFIEGAKTGFETQEGEEPLQISIMRNGTADVLEKKGTILFISEEDGNEYSKTVDFDFKEPSSEVAIDVSDDEVFESDKTFTVRLQSNGECDSLISDEDVAIVTVKDDDSRFYFDDDHLEINENAGTYRLKLGREGTTRSKTVDISVQRSDGDYSNAQSGEDFTLSRNSITFERGENEAYIPVTIINDYLRENDESFDLVLSDPDGIAENLKKPYKITLLILDDDDIYRFQPNYYNVNEGDQSIDVCLQRSGDNTRETIIKLETQDVSTTIGSDYFVSANGIDVMFGKGKSEACTAISILRDSVAEITEIFLVHITSNDIQIEYNTRATVSIHDDADVFISFSDGEYVVNEMAGKVTVYINKAGDIMQAVTVSIKSSFVTTDSDDFDSVTDGIRIPSGTSSVPYEVTIRNDNLDESNEQLKLTLFNPIGGIITNVADTTITIIDDDNTPTTDEPRNVISGGVLAGVLVAVAVIVIVTAVGFALFCSYLLRRPATTIMTKGPQIPMQSFPSRSFPNGIAVHVPFKQSYP